jgi:hypothetical protein
MLGTELVLGVGELSEDAALLIATALALEPGIAGCSGPWPQLVDPSWVAHITKGQQ